jgi:hypothetical protein
MRKHRERLIIHKLILAREFGQRGYWWNRAFRRELWRRLAKDSKSTDQNDGY